MFQAASAAAKALALKLAGRAGPKTAAAAGAGVEAVAESAAASRARLAAKPAMFRRLDGSENDQSNNDSTAAETEAVPPLPTRDAGAAAVAAASGGSVRVMRLMPSRPLPEGAAAEAKETPAQNAATAARLTAAGGVAAVSARVDRTSRGARAFALYEAMQNNPRLLDTAAALAASPGQLIAAQMASGFVPAAARGNVLAGPAGSLPDRTGEIGAPPPPSALAMSSALPALSASGGKEAAPTRSREALLVLERASATAAAEALVPACGTVDEALLRVETELPSGMTAWGPRPAETSPFDQLVLAPEDDDATLNRAELFEIFARHRADPGFWTAERLAEQYDTKPEWVEVLLQYSSPPMYVQVDGLAYGVVEIRDMADLGRDEEATAATAAAAATATGADAHAVHADSRRSSIGAENMPAGGGDSAKP